VGAEGVELSRRRLVEETANAAPSVALVKMRCFVMVEVA
jgi:hypothetical protein